MTPILLTVIPKSLDDRKVLDCVIFKTYRETTTAEKVKKIRNCRYSCTVIELWANKFAFRDKHVNIDEYTITVFVEFFINLRKDKELALTMLNDERKALGLGPFDQNEVANALDRKPIPRIKKVKQKDISAQCIWTGRSGVTSPAINLEECELPAESEANDGMGLGDGGQAASDDVQGVQGSEPPHALRSEGLSRFISDASTSSCHLECTSDSDTASLYAQSIPSPKTSAEGMAKKGRRGRKATTTRGLVSGSSSTTAVSELLSEIEGRSSDGQLVHHAAFTAPLSPRLEPGQLIGDLMDTQDEFLQSGEQEMVVGQPSFTQTTVEPPLKRQKIAHESGRTLHIKREVYEGLVQPKPTAYDQSAPAEPIQAPPSSTTSRYEPPTHARHRPRASIGGDQSLSFMPQPLRSTVEPQFGGGETSTAGLQSIISRLDIATYDNEIVSWVQSDSRIVEPPPPVETKVEEGHSLSIVHSPAVCLEENALSGLHQLDNDMFNEVLDTLPKPESFELPASTVEMLDAGFPKPILPRLPPIWSQSRQEICEGFDWFRSYQGGVYHADNTVKGYLLGGFAAQANLSFRRDVFKHDGKFIISHGGGKSESVHCRDGLYTSTQASDQLADDKSVRSLLENYRTGRPLVLVIDDKYVLFPYDLSARDVTYAVLGFYTIVYAWAEYQPASNESGRVVRYKFAFQWCEEQGDPWWFRPPEPTSPAMSQLTVLDEETEDDGPEFGGKSSESELYTDNSALLSTSTGHMKNCDSCNTASPTVYSTWFCLAPACKMFWKDTDQQLVETPGNYHPDFLQLTSRRWTMQKQDSTLRIDRISVEEHKMSTGYAFTRGVLCPQCGRLSCRSQWERLVCLNCLWEQKVQVDVRKPEDLWSGRLPTSYERFYLNSSSDIRCCPERSFEFSNGGGGRGVVQTFVLPQNRGKLHHIRACNPAGMKVADDVFLQYQEQANSGQLRFRRWPMRAHKCRGTLLTNYFSHNAGEPYQYVGGDANTVSFQDAPAVSNARSLIETRIKEALDVSASFNEVLSCAYMERQKMAFHSDAEVGLGPLVAGLSLGSPALMHFRIHARHDPYYEQRGILLSFVLRHGDVLVMDGSGVQDFYEHTVIPNNFRIAATARQIAKQHHVKSEPILTFSVVDKEAGDDWKL